MGITRRLAVSVIIVSLISTCIELIAVLRQYKFYCDIVYTSCNTITSTFRAYLSIDEFDQYSCHTDMVILKSTFFIHDHCRYCNFHISAIKRTSHWKSSFGCYTPYTHKCMQLLNWCKIIQYFAELWKDYKIRKKYLRIYNSLQGNMIRKIIIIR